MTRKRAQSGRGASSAALKAKKAPSKSQGSAAKKASGPKKGKTQKRVGRVKPQLDPGLLLQIHDLMVKSRKLEERMIQVYKKGDAYFWIGAPGEEAFGVALGLLVKKGQGVDHDFLHLHYRGTPTLIAMGLEMEDALRLIMNRATDPSTGGRNFSNHYCFPKWNVVPVTSPIEVQYGFAIGTGIAQRRAKTDAITVVTGGDAGTAEGDFASCLIWSTRPGFELPIYVTVQNNRWGISTNYESQHGEAFIADRGKAFGMRTRVVNGNDPVETYLAIQEDMAFIRKERRPVLAEFLVSRLYGHSSASGANRIDEECCIVSFEEKLLKWGLITPSEIDQIHRTYEDQAREAADRVRTEPSPEPETIWNHVYAGNENADWRKF